jgi:hypothetical protein
MFTSEIQPPLDSTDTQAISIMKERSNSISASHLSQKPVELNDELKAMDEVLENLPTHALQLDIPIRKIAEDTTEEDVKPRLKFEELPVEVHECVLDHIFGIRASTSSSSAPGKSSAVRGWSSILRHPRRKALSDLALVSSTWRPLVQERLFRHSKRPTDVFGLPANFPSQNQRHP